jgi:HSP20 family protein
MYFPIWRNENSLKDFRREIDRLFEDFWPVPSLLESRDSGNSWVPAAEVEEEDDHYMLTLELPGVSRQDLKLEFIDGQITVSGERKQEEKRGNGHYSERRFGKFLRSFRFPSGVDASGIQAQHGDGILKVYVPKAESAKSWQIPIGESGAGFFARLRGQKDPEQKTLAQKEGDRVA